MLSQETKKTCSHSFQRLGLSLLSDVPAGDCQMLTVRECIAGRGARLESFDDRGNFCFIIELFHY